MPEPIQNLNINNSIFKAMRNKERNKVWQAGKNTGAKQSKLNPFKQIIPQTGDTIKHQGSNVTIVNGKTCYGANAAINAIKGLK